MAHQPANSVGSRGCGKTVEQVLPVQLANRQDASWEGLTTVAVQVQDRNLEMVNYFSLFSFKMRKVFLKSSFSKLL